MAGALAAAALAVLVGIFGVLTFLLLRMSSNNAAVEEPEDQQRKKKDKKQRGRGADAGAEEDEGEGSEGENEDEDDPAVAKRKADKEKKRGEQQAAAAAKRQAQREREDAKAEKNAKYNQQQKEKDLKHEQKEDEERKRREEKERKEKEASNNQKERFAVEPVGADDGDERADTSVERFTEYIKMRKVVNLEDVAAAFKMKSTAAIDRIRQLEKQGRLSGVFDDRGKYVYIPADELEAVAVWMRKKGRINRAELVESCNRLIRLSPTEDAKAKLDEEALSAANRLLTPADVAKEAGT